METSPQTFRPIEGRPQYLRDILEKAIAISSTELSSKRLGLGAPRPLRAFRTTSRLGGVYFLHRGECPGKAIAEKRVFVAVESSSETSKPGTVSPQNMAKYLKCV
ncbi:hypothetical protein NDU88_003745 [Pleurodeles waltl]|uniref:Uncharacterized protein n=1 Tax=Pleurodeles waltl TaxID=8319 RepID=A0AAV7NHI6_PLEWA|nr:hypothetical protein NDU88_003745 [Pleurodeles waltl]